MDTPRQDLLLRNHMDEGAMALLAMGAVVGQKKYGRRLNSKPTKDSGKIAAQRKKNRVAKRSRAANRKRK